MLNCKVMYETKKIEFWIEYYRLTDPLLKRSHFEPVYVIKSLAKYWGTHLREKVQHHKVIKDRAFWPFGDPISICPGCTTTVPAREVVPVYMVVKKMQKITRGLLKFESGTDTQKAMQEQNNACYLILKNTSSEASSSSWKMWLGENHKWSRSRKRPKRLQYRGDIPKADKERDSTLWSVRSVM